MHHCIHTPFEDFDFKMRVRGHESVRIGGTYLEWINHKHVGIMFLLDPVYLGDKGGGPAQTGGCLALAVNKSNV